MARIGLRDLFIAKITEDFNGYESYGIPKRIKDIIQADLTVNGNTVSLYADDHMVESETQANGGTLTLGINEIGIEDAAELTGAQIDENGVLVSSDEDNAPYWAVGFRSMKSNKKFRYIWLYRVKFAVPNASFQTKGETLTYQTDSIVGTFTTRNRPDANGNHPWKADVTEGVAGVTASVITNWFSGVYEMNVTPKDATLSALTVGTETLSPVFNKDTTTYTATTDTASQAITATATASDAKIALIVNGASYANGGTVTLEDGLNTVEITVTNGNYKKAYTVNVTKEA